MDTFIAVKQSAHTLTRADREVDVGYPHGTLSMKYASFALVAMIASSTVIASEPAYTLDTLKSASRQAFLMADSARVRANYTGSTECMAAAHEAMTRAADASLFAIRADDAINEEAASQLVRHGMFNAKRAVKISAICLPSNYKLSVDEAIPYEKAEVEGQVSP